MSTDGGIRRPVARWPVDDRTMCARPDGVWTAARLAESGWTRRRIRAALADGSLTRLRRGIYASPAACEAVTDAAAHGGWPACVTAARHLGLWVLTADERVHVRLGGHGHAYAHPSCSCVEHWDGLDDDVAGPTSVPQMLRQILACHGVEDFFVTLESALRRKMLSAAQLAWLHAHTNDDGREALAVARVDADSGLESLLRWRLRRHRLQVRTQVSIVSVGVVDLLIGDRLLVEADGRDNHHDSPKRHKDLVRDAHAATWGYITLRFDYAMIVHDWETVELAILGIVDRGLHLR